LINKEGSEDFKMNCMHDEYRKCRKGGWIDPKHKWLENGGNCPSGFMQDNPKCKNRSWDISTREKP